MIFHEELNYYFTIVYLLDIMLLLSDVWFDSFFVVMIVLVMYKMSCSIMNVLEDARFVNTNSMMT